MKLEPISNSLPLYAQIFTLWLASKLIFFSIITLISRYTPYSITEIFTYRDSQWYLYIAQNGYAQISTNFTQPLSFPPLYPILIKSLSFITQNLIISALFVSNLTHLIGTIIFYLILRQQLTPTLAKKAVTLFLLSPLSWIFSLPYTESLFFLLSTIFIYGLIKKRTRLLIISLNLLPITRVIGLVFYPSFIWYLFSLKIKLYKKILQLALSAILPMAWTLYLWQNISPPIQIFISQSNWYRQFAPFPLSVSFQIIQTYYFSLKPILSLNRLLGSLPYLIDALLATILVALSIVNIKAVNRLHRLYLLPYLFLAVNFPSFSWQKITSIPPPILGTVRYLTLLLPLYGLITNKYEKYYPVIIKTAIILYVVYLSYFIAKLYTP